MVKKLEKIELTTEQIESIPELSAKVFLEFVRMGDNAEEDAIFQLMAKESLNSIGIEVEDIGEQLSMGSFASLFAHIMEVNKLEELFQNFNRFNRNTPVIK